MNFDAVSQYLSIKKSFRLATVDYRATGSARAFLACGIEEKQLLNGIVLSLCSASSADDENRQRTILLFCPLWLLYTYICQALCISKDGKQALDSFFPHPLFMLVLVFFLASMIFASIAAIYPKTEKKGNVLVVAWFVCGESQSHIRRLTWTEEKKSDE